MLHKLIKRHNASLIKASGQPVVKPFVYRSKQGASLFLNGDDGAEAHE